MTLESSQPVVQQVVHYQQHDVLSRYMIVDSNANPESLCESSHTIEDANNNNNSNFNDGGTSTVTAQQSRRLSVSLLSSFDTAIDTEPGSDAKLELTITEPFLDFNFLEDARSACSPAHPTTNSVGLNNSLDSGAYSPSLSCVVTPRGNVVIPQAKSCPSLESAVENNSKSHQNTKSRLTYRRTQSFWEGIFGCLRPMWALMGGRGTGALRAANDNAIDIINDDNSLEVEFEDIADLTYVGSGAQGVVYRGVLRNQEVAVKRVKERQDTDIRHLRRLQHDNVIRFVGVCSQDPECYCIIMEFAPFGQLYSILKKHRELSAVCIVDWMNQVCQGMHYLHQNKIVHRDLKSPNVLVSAAGSNESYVLKISDFGTCREWQGGNTAPALHMTFVGTPAWMAPEMLRGEPCGPRVDIWSFGVVLWEILTGTEPFQNVSSNSIMWQVGNYQRTLHLPASLPPRYVAVLKACWSQEARERPGFRQLGRQLELCAADLLELSHEELWLVRDAWRTEIAQSLNELKQENPAKREAELIRRRKRELADAATLRQRYEDKLVRTDNLIMETTQFYLQVEERQRKLEERERRLARMRRDLVRLVQTGSTNIAATIPSNNKNMMQACSCGGSAQYLNHTISFGNFGSANTLPVGTAAVIKPTIKQRVEKLGRKFSHDNFKLFNNKDKFFSMEDVRSAERTAATRHRQWRKPPAPSPVLDVGLDRVVCAPAPIASPASPSLCELHPVIERLKSVSAEEEEEDTTQIEPRLRHPDKRRCRRDVADDLGEIAATDTMDVSAGRSSASSGESCILDDPLQGPRRSQLRCSTDQLREELEAVMLDSLSDKEGEIGRLRHQLQQSSGSRPATTLDTSSEEDRDDQEQSHNVSQRRKGKLSQRTADRQDRQLQHHVTVCSMETPLDRPDSTAW